MCIPLLIWAWTDRKLRLHVRSRSVVNRLSAISTLASVPWRVCGGHAPGPKARVATLTPGPKGPGSEIKLPFISCSETWKYSIYIASVYYIKIVKIAVFRIFRVNFKILPEYLLLQIFVCDLGTTWMDSKRNFKLLRYREGTFSDTSKTLEWSEMVPTHIYIHRGQKNWPFCVSSSVKAFWDRAKNECSSVRYRFGVCHKLSG